MARLQVWPKAVDCQRFHPAHASREMRRRLEGGHRGAASGDASDASGPLLLFVGRVSSEKNLELLREVLERVPGGRLAVVGDGPAMEVRRRSAAQCACMRAWQLPGKAAHACGGPAAARACVFAPACGKLAAGAGAWRCCTY